MSAVNAAQLLYVLPLLRLIFPFSIFTIDEPLKPKNSRGPWILLVLSRYASSFAGLVTLPMLRLLLTLKLSTSDLVFIKSKTAFPETGSFVGSPVKGEITLLAIEFVNIASKSTLRLLYSCLAINTLY